MKSYTDFDTLKQELLEFRKKKQLHPITEENLKLILNELFPRAHPIGEINVNGGRDDFNFFIPPSNKKVHFEIFASKSQVPQDLRLLENSISDLQIAIIIDKEIDPKVIDEYYRKKPSKPFPCYNLSDLFLENKIEEFKKQLRDKISEILDEGLCLKNNEIESKRNEFLKKIGQKDCSYYKYIEYVYVPPINFNDIEKFLQTNRIIFITGNPGFGKTYTAIYLLWKYFNLGYVIKWFHGKGKIERKEVAKKLQKINIELKPNTIIYFEDPFGRSSYIKNRNLEKEISKIIKKVRNSTNTYIIITSRSEVFKDFKKNSESKDLLEICEKKISLHKNNYTLEKRREILIKLAELKRCDWYENQEFKEFILKKLSKNIILPTPLNIREFIYRSSSINTKDELKSLLNLKSQESYLSFAKEMKNMTKDKKLFISFIFILEYLKIDFLSEIYQRLVSEYSIKDADNFDEILNWFKEDKIIIDAHNCIKFSHSLYSESLKYLLYEDNQYKEFFENILIQLSEIEDITMNIVFTIIENFNEFSENTKELLYRFSEKESTAWQISPILSTYFDELPKKMRNKLLLNLSEKEKGAMLVALAIKIHFDKIPKDVRNNSLLKLSEIKTGEILEVLSAVKKNFLKLPENVRNKLLIKFSENKFCTFKVVELIRQYFEDLPKNLRNELILKLSKKENSLIPIAFIVVEHYNKLPKNVRALLFTLSNNEEFLKYALAAVKIYSNKLPEDVKKDFLQRISK